MYNYIQAKGFLIYIIRNLSALKAALTLNIFAPTSFTIDEVLFENRYIDRFFLFEFGTVWTFNKIWNFNIAYISIDSMKYRLYSGMF